MLEEFRKFKGWSVLEYFLKNDKQISIRELSRELKISSMTSKHYCDLLENSGLLVSQKAGTAKLFQLADTVESRQWKRAYIIQQIHEKNLYQEINNAFYVFGSIVTGKWKPHSDFDLFIIKIHEFDKVKVEEIISKLGFEPSILVVDFFNLDKFKESNSELIREIKKGIYLGDETYEL